MSNKANISIRPSKKYDKSFFIGLNMQNVPRPTFHMWYVRKADETSIPEYTVEDWEFTLERRPDSIGKVEGAHPDRNFRKCFLPEPGHYLVSRDFSGQELRILANLSGERGWIETFLENGDIHARTAITLWGAENYTREKRNHAKAINFGLVYGIGAQGLSNDIGSTEAEAQEYIDKFFELHPDIDRFLKRQARIAGQNKSLANHYGRARRFHLFENQYNRNELNNAGKRRAYNFPIQGAGADVTKLGLLNVYYNIIQNPDFKGKALFMSTIHDEINLSVDKTVIKEVVYKMGEVMTHKIPPNYPVLITTGLEIGNSMGLIWGFKQDPETLELTPDYEPLEEN